ncbi:MAG: permease [Pirellulales bacterium]
MTPRYRWASTGDINAFFGLILDNIAGLILIVSLLHENFGFPVPFALRYMIPGTAIGVLMGDLMFFFLALRLAKTSGSSSVTAMPLGIDTPSTFGMAFFVLGPAFAAAKNVGMDADAAAYHAWQIGICSIFLCGVIKMICAIGSGMMRRMIPRAGLLGSLAAIALVLISFFPLLEVLKYPLVGLVSLAIILTALVGRVPLPLKIPGAVGGLIVAGLLYAFMSHFEFIKPAAQSFKPEQGLWPTEWLGALSFSWMGVMGETMNYLPLIIPFALATVVGGIDCTESAAAVGDHYDTRTVIAIEAIATFGAAAFGAVLQTTPYIGHPAYKAMGGRAAYTLATAIAMGLLGVTGLFGYFYQFIPAAAVFPILVFVGLEIGAQSFIATPKRHYTAVALACVPALAVLAVNFMDQIWPDPNILNFGNNPAFQDKAELVSKVHTAQLLSRGFILTSIIWASALALAIDRKLVASGIYYFVGALCTLFGLIHSPLPTAPIHFPFPMPGIPESIVLDESMRPEMWNWCLGYAIVGVLMIAWAYYLKATKQEESEYDLTESP